MLIGWLCIHGIMLQDTCTTKIMRLATPSIRVYIKLGVISLVLSHVIMCTKILHRKADVYVTRSESQ